MALYRYVKSPPKKKKPVKLFRFLSASFLLLGVLLIAQVVYPILGWYFLVLPAVGSGIASPLASNFRPQTSPLFPTIVQASETVTQTMTGKSQEEASFSPDEWFVGEKEPVEAVDTTRKEYTLSIPKLQVEQAHVKTGGEDLKKNLIAWETSVVPGSYGNVIIFGHSALPQISSPKSYSSMFTHLMSMEDGDEIVVHYDNQDFTYEVVSKKIVTPTNLSVLEQRFDAPYITLITCEPPGTLWMRGVVQARLVK